MDCINWDILGVEVSGAKSLYMFAAGANMFNHGEDAKYDVLL